MKLKRKRKTYGKRALSLLLCAGMLVPSMQGLTVRAAEKEPVYLKSSRIAADKLPEGDYIYFGTASATVEERGEYAVKLYREGNLDKKASVDIHTIDMMALYGEDYELDMEGVRETGDGESILEKYVKGKAVTGTDEPASVAASSEPEESSVKSFEEIVAESRSTGTSASETSTLAKEKEEQTGEKSRELVETEPEEQGLMDAIMGELIADAMEDLDSSSESTVTFEKGESEKTVKFRILEDDKTEGTEGFSLLLVNPQDAELYEVTSLSVSIRDAQKAEHSKVSFSKKEYQAKDGKVAITVKRTGAEYSVCELALRTSGETAKAGTNYTETNMLISFAPYEMEKKVELDVCGSGTFKVMLTDLTACDEGEFTKASVEIKEGKEISKPSEALRAAAKAGTSSFDISIKGQNYTVEYTKGAATGKIMDNSYEPAVQAGTYYFAADKSHGGYFTYGHLGGDKPSWLGHRDTDYQTKGEYGRLRYYSPTAWHKGWVYGELPGANVWGAYYNYFIPDWATDDGTTGAGERRLEVWDGNRLIDTTYSHGSHGRQQNENAIVNKKDQKVTVRVYAYDTSGSCRKSYIKLYGLCAMYRKFNISVENGTALKYEGSTSAGMEPLTVTVDCGAQPKDANIDTRDIYANQDTNKSNLVFSVKDSYVNGHNGMFGHIKGYQITIDPGKGNDKITKLNYPNDYVSWLRSKKGNKIGISNSEIDRTINKVNANLDTVPYDRLFVQWISANQKDTATDNISYGYKQNLKFKPVFDYNNVTVEVLAPNGGGKGHFTDSKLSKTGKYTFHAGDNLTLDAVADDAGNYEVIGYEVSTDGVNFNTIRDTKQLFLEGSLKLNYYRIRPVIQRKKNVIEINFKDNNAKSKFEIQGLISQSALNSLGKDYESLKGKNILITNPEGRTTLDKITPVPGKEYMVRILQKDSSGNTVYQPRVKMKSANTTYTTQLFQFVAGSSPVDNVVEIGSRSVPRSSLKTFRVIGSLNSAYAPIRANGLEVKHLPVQGYTLSAGAGTQNKDKNGKAYVESVSTTSDDKGAFMLTGITGVEGDIVPVFVSNGITNGQIVDVKLQAVSKSSDVSSYEVKLSKVVEIKYPYGAPEVTSIDYTFSNPNHIQENGGVGTNSVNIYDDEFTVDATVNTRGKDIKEAIFTVYTVNGQTTEFRAQEDRDNRNHFVCTIPGMADNLNNGDRIKVRLVDRDKMYSEAGKDENGENILDDEGQVITGIDWNIEYPDVDTGLVFYVENVLMQPKWYDVQDDKTAANIPLIGNATSSTQSGLLSLNKIRWADDNGYTLQIGVDVTHGNMKTPSTEDKAQMVDNFMKAVRADKANAEEIALGKKAGSTQKGGTNLKQEKKEMQNAIKNQKQNSAGQAKNAVAKMNEKEPSWKVDVAFMLAFDFLWNPEVGDYQFITGGVAVGGSFTFNHTMYTMISSVPAFVNFSATLQANLTVSYATETGMNAMTAGDFNSYGGNLSERITPPKAVQSLMASGKVQVGIGLCGVLSARGYVAPKVQFDIGLTKSTPSGVLLGFAGGIGFDLLILSINLDFFSVTKGWGSLEKKTSYSFFGGMLDQQDLGIKTAAKKKSAVDTSGDKVLKQYGEDEVMVRHMYSSGTSDMSEFGKTDGRKRATPELVAVNTLLDNAAEHTRPKIVPLNEDNTKKMLVFIGSRGNGEESNSSALYYSVYDGSNWSMPKILDKDGTVDSAPDIIVGKGADGKDKVVIAWADACREFTSSDTSVDKLNTMGISAIVYDVESGTMGDEIPMVADDPHFNLSPKLNFSNGILYCSYMKRDIANVEGEEDLLDFAKTYSTMAYVAYDTHNQRYVSYDKDGNQQDSTTAQEQFISIHHPTVQDPLVMDYQSITTEVESKTYMLSTYTVDGDKNLQTKEDRELFLSISNMTDGKEYYPIQVTNDQFSQSSPKLTDIDGTVYLTWLDNGYIFRMADVSEVLGSLFDSTTGNLNITADDSDMDTAVQVTVNKDAYKDGYIASGDVNSYKDWYKKSAGDLGVTEEYYEDSIYKSLAESALPAESANFSQRDDMETSISNYTVTSDGKDIYIFFTDFGTKDESNTGVEIYGVRYQRYFSDKDTSAGSGTGDTDSVNAEQKWGFGKAVQITDNNKVIDELDLYMDSDTHISAVANYFEQYINSEGGMSYSSNRLVELEFGTKGSMEVEDGYIKLPDAYVSGETEEISFDVINNGLLTSKGYKYSVYEVAADGSEKLIANDEVDAVLGSGEVQNVIVPWEVPQELSGTKIKVTVEEIGVDHSIVKTTECDVPYGSNLEFTDVQVLWNEKEPYLSATVKNTGNAASKAYSAALCISDNDGNTTKTYKNVEIPALASGEEKSLNIPFTPAVEDFNGMGVIWLKLVVSDGGEIVAEANTKFSSITPVCAQINDGKDIALDYGKKAALTTKAAPWNGIAGEVRFYSSDEAVAAVDDKGIVTGTGNGEAVIYAYYPVFGVMTSVKVKVSGTGSSTTVNPAPPQNITPTVTPEPTATPEPVSTSTPSPVVTPTPVPDIPVEETAGTKEILSDKKSLVIAPGKSASVGYNAVVDVPSAVKAANVTVSVSGNKNVTAKLKDSKVRITANKKAVRGSEASVSLLSTDASGKKVKAVIKVRIQNKAKKLTVKKKNFTVKKGHKKKLVLTVKAQNDKKATTDTVKVSSGIVSLTKSSVKKKQVTLTLKGKKKGSRKITIKVGSKTIKLTVKVK